MAQKQTAVFRLTVRTLLLVWIGAALMLQAAFMLGRTALQTDLLAFESNRAGNFEIFLSGTNRDLAVNITRNPSQDRLPQWSPDGRYLAFESFRFNRRSGGGNGIFVLDVWNRQSDTRIIPYHMRGSQPTWSPDGRYMVFSGSMGEMLNNDLFVVSVTDGKLIRITNTPGLFENNPQWSPDGTMIAYGMYDPMTVSPSSIHVTPFISPGVSLVSTLGHSIQVSDHPGASYPSWTPDNEVVYLTEQGERRLYVAPVSPDGEDRLLGNIPYYLEQPRLSSDGEWVVFSSAIDQTARWRNLYMIRPDGTDLRQITYGAERSQYRDSSPVLAPR